MNTHTVPSIPFMRFRKVAGAFSIVLLLLSIGSLATKGLNLGLDFSGGTLVEYEYAAPVPVEDIRVQLAELGVDDAVVVLFGADTDILFRTRLELDQTRALELASALSEAGGAAVELKRIELVGPQVGEELREQGGLGMLVALALVMLYIALRFQYKFSVAGVAALFHDVLITLGVFSVFQFDFDLTVLAAILAVIGYSLNDTIVVFDRIRENFRALRQVEVGETIDISLTQTLTRTLITSLTTLIVLVVLFFFGGEMIRNFSLALIIGVVIGTYSSIYVASSLAYVLNVSKQDLMPPKLVDPEGEPGEEVPYS